MLSNHDIQKKNEELTKMITKCTVFFNALSLKVGESVLSEFPDNKELFFYNQVISDMAKKNPNEPICLFLENVYTNVKYRESILTSDENFFKSDNHDQLTSGDRDKMKAMFFFKSVWDKLTKELKLFIKKAMIQLTQICKQYIDLQCDKNSLTRQQ